MGAIFKLEHANIMAYVTSRSYCAPRVSRSVLFEFLNALAYNAREFLIPEIGFEPWPEQISKIANRAMTRLDKMWSNEQREIISGQALEELLGELRSEFSDYPLYSLAVGSGQKLKNKAREIAHRQMHGGLLVLIPDDDTHNRNFDVLDPIPAFSVALHAIADWPGMLFWTANGANAFAPLDQVDELIHELHDALHHERHRRHTPWPHWSMASIDAVLRKWESRRPLRSRRLLHLSDLHFGTNDASENQPMLDAELRDVVKTVDRVVITGDLTDTPDKNFTTLFTTFRNGITYLAAGREPIAITGNHDQRIKGILGDKYEEVAKIGPPRIIADDNCQMIFICFNSSIEGILARGQITGAQFRQLGAEYRNLLSSRPELKGFLPLVLVHHHPFSFNDPPDTWIQRVLSAIGRDDESLLVLEDSEDLHRWCLDWNINTVLHGHKHKRRYIQKEVANNGNRMLLTAIGCGSSLGANGSPMSYNMLEWDPRNQRWVASFYESANGGAFHEICTSISPERVNQPGV
jgi:hypothetical protein